MPLQLSASRPNWNTVSALVKRAERADKQGLRVSVDDRDVPPWQRSGNAWSAEQKGMLALSIIQGYPIGQILLWEKPDGTLVPIDGRQRLTAILGFANGDVRVPTVHWVPEDYRGKRYKIAPGAKGDALPIDDTDSFDEYIVDLLVYPPSTPESVLMDMFVRLQGGTPLNKAEVRAALGTGVADFVTELTDTRGVATEDEELEEDVVRGHEFFKDLSGHYRNRRKSHRQVCDQLLNEYLNGDPGAEYRLDHHWESLTKMYRTHSLKASEKTDFKKTLTAFGRAFKVDKRLSTALSSPNLISTWFRVWSHFREVYAVEPKIAWGKLSEDFEATRLANASDEPFKSFKTAIAASGYTAERNTERARIVEEWLLEQLPAVKTKDPKRLFTPEQKYVIWHRAGGQCQWEEKGKRCKVKIPNPHSAAGHADHVERFRAGGATSVANGRLLCAQHNLQRG